MVARIKSTQSLSRSLNYNEKKVQLGVAECIHAVNYPKDVEHLNFYDKLHRLEHLAELNERVKANKGFHFQIEASPGLTLAPLIH